MRQQFADAAYRQRGQPLQEVAHVGIRIVPVE
jgi:hypothetical protein